MTLEPLLVKLAGLTLDLHIGLCDYIFVLEIVSIVVFGVIEFINHLFLQVLDSFVGGRLGILLEELLNDPINRKMLNVILVFR